MFETNELTKELSFNFIEYAAGVNSDRAIPDAKSGLKPVARRILWGSYYGKYLSSKEYAKCAKIVGDIMGLWHPHGDSSIYGALVRLSQPWIMRYPLIEFHGNMGNQNGDGPAAYRYTNARLAKISEDGLLYGINKNNVDFIPNYDENENEPVTLPAIFPNLLCNPNSGIGVAQACNWASHNLKEVAEVIYAYIDNKDIPILAADFPTGGVIINKNEFDKINKTGKGSIKLRGQYKLNQNKIIFYEIPYGISVESLLQEVSELCEKRELFGIEDIQDQSSKTGVQIVVECEKDIDVNSVIRQLFQKTNFQISFSYNQIALVNKTPTELNLKDCIKIYIEHNIECIKREAQFDLNKASQRLHIIDGLLIALEDIDNVIQLIKNSNDSKNAQFNLIQKYKLSENQAKSILAMKLSSLAKLEKIELEQEKQEIISTINDLKFLLTDKEQQLKTIKQRLQKLVDKYGDARRTQLLQLDEPKIEKEVIEVIPQECIVSITESNLIKRTPSTNYKTQKRGGVGVKNKDDIIAFTCRTNTQDNLMVFSSKGKMYKILVDKIPEKNTRIDSLIAFESNEKPMAYASLYKDSPAEFVFFATKQGYMKKVPIAEFTKMKKGTGISAINFHDGDELAAVTFINNEDMLLITKLGMSIHIQSNFGAASRIAMGIKGINLREDDEVLACLPIHKTTDELLVVDETGCGKRFELRELTLQNRGGVGLTISKTAIAGVCLVDNKDKVLITGNKNTICIDASSVPSVLTRTSMGNILIKNNRVMSVSKV